MTMLDTDTRSRILETAWKLVRDRGTNGVTIAEIAAAAGVSRQLIYFHFQNRAGLLVAMARHHDVRSGFVERVPRRDLSLLWKVSKCCCGSGATTFLRSCPSHGRWRRR
jgi:AcrR family transcriptional regulator